MQSQCQHILHMKILGYQKYNYKATYFGNTSCIPQHPEHSQPWPKGKPGHSLKRNRIKNSDLFDTPSLPNGNQTLQRKIDKFSSMIFPFKTSIYFGAFPLLCLTGKERIEVPVRPWGLPLPPPPLAQLLCDTRVLYKSAKCLQGVNSTSETRET